MLYACLGGITMDINSTEAAGAMQVPCVCDHHMLSNQDEPCIFGHSSLVTHPNLYIAVFRMTSCGHGKAYSSGTVIQTHNIERQTLNGYLF